MNQPNRDIRTSDSKIFVNWSSLEDYDKIGGSVIISYGL
jgi:hypothetical protein